MASDKERHRDYEAKRDRTNCHNADQVGAHIAIVGRDMVRAPASLGFGLGVPLRSGTDAGL